MADTISNSVRKQQLNDKHETRPVFPAVLVRLMLQLRAFQKEPVDDWVCEVRNVVNDIIKDT